MTWYENCGTKVQQGMSSAYSLLHVRASQQLWPMFLFPFCTKSTPPAAVRLWVCCPALLPCNGAVVIAVVIYSLYWGPLAWWTSNPRFALFNCITSADRYCEQLNFHLKQPSWMLPKPHLVVFAPSACHRDVTPFGHCIMKATLTSCDGHLKISKSKLWLRLVTGDCLDHRKKVVGEDASVTFRGNTKKSNQKNPVFWYVTQNISGTEQGPSDLNVGCLLTVECTLFPRQPYRDFWPSLVETTLVLDFWSLTLCSCLSCLALGFSSCDSLSGYSCHLYNKLSDSVAFVALRLLIVLIPLEYVSYAEHLVG